MSRYNKILAAAVGLAALTLFMACDDGPTGLDQRETQVGEEDAVKLIPEWNFIVVGEWLRLRAILPGGRDGGGEEAEKLEWESSNPTVAIVTDGVVRGLEPGTVLITAEFDGYRGSAHVMIRDRAQYRNHEPDIPDEDDEIK